jgi:SAM-dependent methyltransferase
MRALPYPPEAQDATARYDEIGAALAAAVERAVGEDWSWNGRRVLDLACGAGGVLRHLAVAHPEAEWWGTDADVDGVEWLQAHGFPPIRAIVRDREPPLAVADGRFDLVYAVSTEASDADRWTRWQAEAHRVLKPGGVFVATVDGSIDAQTRDSLPAQAPPQPVVAGAPPSASPAPPDVTHEELAYLRERYATLQKIEAGGWWRLHEAMLPVLRPLSRALRRK